MRGKTIHVAIVVILAWASWAIAAGEYGYVDTWVSGGRCGSDSEATGLQEFSPLPNDQAGYGIQSNDAAVNTFPMVGPVSTNVAGWAGGNAESWVDPVGRQIKTYAHAYSSGRGPNRYEVNLLGQSIYFQWPSTMGASYSRGYLSNMVHVQPGTSGLADGDTVQLLLELGLTGDVELNPVKSYQPQPTVYLASQVTDITDTPADELQQRELVWNAREGEIHLGSNTYSQQQMDRVVGYYHVATDNISPFVAEQVYGQFPQDDTLIVTPDGQVEQGPITIDVTATVGRWYLLEIYLETDMELPNHPNEYTDEMGIDPDTGSIIYSAMYGTADFRNTLQADLRAATGYEDIELVNAFAPQVPEPVCLTWLAIAVGTLPLKRRR